MSVDISKITKEVLSILTPEVEKEPTYSATILENKVIAVVKELIQLRRYSKTTMTDEQITNDLDNYFTQILNVTRYDFNRIGAEGEDRHSENGVDRTYTSREKLWKGVVPLGRMI